MQCRHFLIPQGSLRKLVRASKCICLLFFYILLLAACNPATPTSYPVFTATNTLKSETQVSPTSTSLPTIAQPVVLPTPTELSHSIWLAAYIPNGMRSAITLPDGFHLAGNPDKADVTLEVDQQNLDPASLWIYALVAPFPTIMDGITAAALKSAWDGESVTPFTGISLLMDQSTMDVFIAFWGSPNSKTVHVLPGDQLLDYAWSNRPSFAIIPFEELTPQWKVLTIDGQSPVHKDFNPSAYPLAVPFVLTGNVPLQPEEISLPIINRDATRLTTLAMTGVTALVRATAFTMEHKGVTYPAQDIGALLADADITHISNEIPFSPDCPYPDPAMSSLVFCSNPSYIDLLKAIGTDIVELTGDHFMDYGSAATIYTLGMYKELGWQFYGGGENAEAARQPVLVEDNGNRLAFMGCNIGCKAKTGIPCDATATDSHPGAALCDFNWMGREIRDLTEEGYQVIFTFQHQEYYTYTTEPILAYDFGQIAAAGASIISGSQAHQPQGFSFQDGSFIHYGLGNLFFDQYHFCADYACDDAFIDRYVFYAGRHISTELITIHFVDTARPRLMTSPERARFLETIFTASGW